MKYVQNNDFYSSPSYIISFDIAETACLEFFVVEAPRILIYSIHSNAICLQ